MADDEWIRVAANHVDALRALDEIDGLGVLDGVGGLAFDEAVVNLWADEVDKNLPFKPKDRLMAPEPMECPEWWRETLLSTDFDDWGLFAGEGVCLACGYERTHEDTIDGALEWRMGRGD